MNEKMKKALITVGVVLCLMVAADKIYNFYQAHQPPFEVGECFVASDDAGEIRFVVIDNDKGQAVSSMVGTIDDAYGIPGLKVMVPGKTTFAAIRASNARKVECQ